MSQWVEISVNLIGGAIAVAYLRIKTDKAATRVVNGTAAQSTSDDILKRVKQLEQDNEILKSSLLKITGLDDRGPKKGDLK